MPYILLLSVCCAVWGITPNMEYPALWGLITVQVSAIVMTYIVTRNKRRDERLDQLRYELIDTRAQLDMLSADKLFEGKVISAQRSPFPRTGWLF